MEVNLFIAGVLVGGVAGFIAACYLLTILAEWHGKDEE